MNSANGPERLGIVLAILFGIAVDFTYFSLLPTNEGFRPIWLYFVGMAIAPWLALMAWSHSRRVVAAVLFLAPNVALGGILPFFLPLSLVLAFLAVRQQRRTQVSEHVQETA